MDFFSGAPKREPSSDKRQSADELHEMYTSYVDAGFTKEQAMRILLQMLSATIAANQRPTTD